MYDFRVSVFDEEDGPYPTATKKERIVRENTTKSFSYDLEEPFLTYYIRISEFALFLKSKTNNSYVFCYQNGALNDK